MNSAATPQQPQRRQSPPPVRERRRMARRRGYGADADEWVDRWRDGVDVDIAQLQRDYIEAGKTMVEVRQWIINHDIQHTNDRNSRQRIPDDVRGWIGVGISIFTLLLMLYLQNQR